MQCIRREIPFIFGIRWLTLVYTFLGFIPQHCSTQLYHWQSLPAEFNPKHKRQKAKPGVCDMKWCNAVTQWFLSLLKLWEYHLLQYHCSMTYWKNISTRAVCESVCVLLPSVVETWGADRLLFNRLQGEHGDPLIVCTHAHTHTAPFLSQNSVEYSYTEAVETLPGARVCAGRGACTQHTAAPTYIPSACCGGVFALEHQRSYCLWTQHWCRVSAAVTQTRQCLSVGFRWYRCVLPLSLCVWD